MWTASPYLGVRGRPVCAPGQLLNVPVECEGGGLTPINTGGKSSSKVLAQSHGEQNPEVPEAEPRVSPGQDG